MTRALAVKEPFVFVNAIRSGTLTYKWLRAHRSSHVLHTMRIPTKYAMPMLFWAASLKDTIGSLFVILFLIAEINGHF